MQLNWETYRGSNPEVYGRQVIDRCGFTEPPICEKAVSQFFGNKIEEVSPLDPDIAAKFPTIRKIFKKSSAHLFRDYSLIVVNKDQPRVKIRMDIFHENGHEALPWQRESAHVCAGSGVDAYTRRRIEDEAFRCGIAMMLPDKMFREDVRGRKMSEELIRALAQRYEASLEVAAMRYVGLCNGVCAMLVCEPIKQKEPETGMETVVPEQKRLLQIRYAVTSHRLMKFFQAGTIIGDDSPIYLPFLTGETFGGPLYTDDLGYGYNTGHPYAAECFRFGTTEEPKVMALLWSEDQQKELF